MAKPFSGVTGVDVLNPVTPDGVHSELTGSLGHLKARGYPKALCSPTRSFFLTRRGHDDSGRVAWRARRATFPV